MCVKSLAALSDILTPALYGNMLRLYMVLKPMSPRNSVGIHTRDPHLSHENLVVMDKAGHQDNCLSEQSRTKGSITMLPRNRMNVYKSSQSKQKSPW